MTAQSQENNEQDHFANQRSHVKGVYVEVHDYKYHHKPSDVDQIDSRFIGRAGIERKLKELLTKSETKTGAYLVTGHRGIGKSSVVNKVLSDLGSDEFRSYRSGRLLRILLILILLSLLTPIDINIFSCGDVYLRELLFPLIFTLLALYLLSPLFSWRTSARIPFRSFSFLAAQLWERFQSLILIDNVNSELRNFSSKVQDLATASVVYLISLLVLDTSVFELILGICLTVFLFVVGLFAHKQHKMLSADLEKSGTEDDTLNNNCECYTHDKKNDVQQEMGVKESKELSYTHYTKLLRQKKSVAIIAGFIVTSIFLFLINVSIYQPPLYSSHVLTHCVICLVGLRFATALYDSASLVNLMEELNSTKVNMWRTFGKLVKSWCVQKYERWNNGTRMCIRVNLGYDAIREIDILRLIARKLQRAYEQFNDRRVGFAFVKVGIVLAVTTLFYNLDSVRQFHQNVREDLGIDIWLPSQNSVLLDSRLHFLVDYEPAQSGDQKQNIPEVGFFSTGKDLELHVEKIDSIPGSEPKWDAVCNDATSIRELRSGLSLISYGYDDGTTIFTNESSFRRIITSIDELVFNSYKYIRALLPLPFSTFRDFKETEVENSTTDRSLSSAHTKTLLPDSIDYFFFSYLIIGYFFIGFLVRRSWFGFESNGSIQKQLRNLNERIVSNVRTEEAQELSASRNGLGVKNRRRRTLDHPLADEREIEVELIAILESIDQVPRLLRGLRFIIVFDEIDKIEPQENSNIATKEEEDVLQNSSAFISLDALRKRQHKVFNLLSNLKHFLTTAHANFIFIAGRDLYDASLADVSDRNFFVNSVFHSVLNVKSFLSERVAKQHSDVTRMTEAYVCQFLLPYGTELPSEVCRLSEYHAYLRRLYTIGSDSGINSDVKEKIFHVMVMLKQFVTHLAYRSNGAPKKITAYLEHYLKNLPIGFDSISQINFHNNVFGQLQTSRYLYFDYSHQYKFAMITRLYKPFQYYINQTIEPLGDKLLVSTSFLLDHLYKYHGSAFSWRNLELTPEIVDINRAPHLRIFFRGMIELMIGKHMHRISSGLFHFRFTSRSAAEIDFISKVSDTESAALNFTLDESLLLKRHYELKLRALTRKRANSSKSETFDNSLSFINIILGDLHFYDEEYNDAILHYMEAVRPLRNVEVRTIPVNQFVLYVRNLLKLGLTFERRKTFESAFMLYSELSNLIIRYREVDARNLGLEQVIVKLPDSEDGRNRDESAQKKPVVSKDLRTRMEQGLVREFKSAADRPDSSDSSAKIQDKYAFALVRHKDTEARDLTVSEILKYFFEESDRRIPSSNELEHKFNENIQPRTHKNFENATADNPWGVQSITEDFSSLLQSRPFTSAKDDLLYRMTTYESIRLLHQPLLAKLQITEKSNLGGITINDVERVEMRFQHMIQTIQHNQKYLLRAGFKKKLGDILFYKNGPQPGDSQGKHCMFAQKCTLDFTHCLSSAGQSAPLYSSCFATQKYAEACSIIIGNLISLEKDEDSNQHILCRFANAYAQGDLRMCNNDSLVELADAVSALGDVLLSASQLPPDFVSQKTVLNELHLLLSESLTVSVGQNVKLNDKNLKFCDPTLGKHTTIKLAFLAYIMACLIYETVGSFKHATSHVVKVLQVLKYFTAAAANELKLTVNSNGRGNGSGPNNQDFNLQEFITSVEQVAKRGIMLVSSSVRGSDRQECFEYAGLLLVPQTDGEGCKQFESDTDVNCDDPDWKQCIPQDEVILEIQLLKAEICANCGKFSHLANLHSLTPTFARQETMRGRILYLLNKAKLQELRYLELFSKFELPRANQYSGGAISCNPCTGKSKQDGAHQMQELTHEVLEQYGYCIRNDISISHHFCEQLFASIIADAMFCLTTSIFEMNVFGQAFVVNHIALAKAHSEMALWCIRLKNFHEDMRTKLGLSVVNPFDEILKYKLRAFSEQLSSEYHEAEARRHCNLALQTHNQGQEYKNLIESMYYLEDDFADEDRRFDVALERFQIIQSSGGLCNNINSFNPNPKEPSSQSSCECTCSKVCNRDKIEGSEANDSEQSRGCEKTSVPNSMTDAEVSNKSQANV